MRESEVRLKHPFVFELHEAETPEMFPEYLKPYLILRVLIRAGDLAFTAPEIYNAIYTLKSRNIKLSPRVW